MRTIAASLGFVTLLFICCLLVPAYGAGDKSTVADLDRKLGELTTYITELEAQVASLEGRVSELEGGSVAPPTEEEPTLADLVAAAEREAAQAEPEAEEEAPVFASGALGLQALNPEISVTGDFVSSYRSGDAVAAKSDNTLRTLGVHIESYLDPYSRFKAAVPVTDDKAKIGEAYFTRYGWLPDTSVTLGRFRQQFGVVNRWHKHGLDQVDFPLPLRQIFGDGGLNQTGLSLEWQLPPWRRSVQELTFQVTDGENGRLFGQNSKNFPAVLAHYKNYRDISKDAYLEFGLTALTGRNDTWDVLSGASVVSQQRDLWTTVLGADLTYLWEPTESMRYDNAVWRTEAYLLNKDILAPDGSGKDTLRASGLYSYYQRKLNRTLDAGIRVDYFKPDVKSYAAIPGLSLAPLAVPEHGAHQWLFAPYVTWHQSPWVHWRLECNHLDNRHMGPDEDALFLQCVFAAGPHKHERY